MKRLLAMLMVLCLCCGAAMAEDLYWPDVSSRVTDAGYKGKFATFQEVAVRIWLPESFTAAVLDDGQRDGGLIGSFRSEELNANVVVNYTDLYGVDLEALRDAALTNPDCTNVTVLAINDLPALRYYTRGGDRMVLEFVTQRGYDMKFSMWPIYGGAPSVVWDAISASIQPE